MEGSIRTVLDRSRRSCEVVLLSDFAIQNCYGTGRRWMGRIVKVGRNVLPEIQTLTFSIQILT